MVFLEKDLGAIVGARKEVIIRTGWKVYGGEAQN
jgi:hypothetical protein